MKTTLKLAALSAFLISSAPVFAAVKTVKLNVSNMYCAACPYTVKSALSSVKGVDKVSVSFRDKTATVSFDDAKTSIAALTQATTKAGYPSALSSK